MATSVIDYTMFQKQITEWAAKNFGRFRGWHQPFVGIVEEMGELFESLEKKNYDESEDAIADMMIYIGDLCGIRNWKLNELISDYHLVSLGRDLLSKRNHTETTFHFTTFSLLGSWVGKLGHALLKQEQGIRGSFDEHEEDAQRAISHITSTLHLICRKHQWNRDEITFKTWDEIVSKRDWKKNSQDGAS